MELDKKEFWSSKIKNSLEKTGFGNIWVQQKNLYCTQKVQKDFKQRLHDNTVYCGCLPFTKNFRKFQNFYSENFHSEQMRSIYFLVLGLSEHVCDSATAVVAHRRNF